MSAVRRREDVQEMADLIAKVRGETTAESAPADVLLLRDEVFARLGECRTLEDAAALLRRIGEREQARHEREEGNARRAAKERAPQPRDGTGDRPKSNGVSKEAALWLELAGEMPGDG